MNGLNRAIVAALALVALAAGVLGALATLGALDPHAVNDVIPYRDAWASWNDIDWQKDVPRWSLLAGAVVVGLLALALLVLEVAPGRGPSDRLVIGRDPRGTTALSRGALRRAAERGARRVEGVARADLEELRVEGDSPPTARYRVRADETAHLPTLGARVADEAGAALERMLGRPAGEITVVMEVRHDRRAETRKRGVE